MRTIVVQKVEVKGHGVKMPDGLDLQPKPQLFGDLLRLGLELRTHRREFL